MINGCSSGSNQSMDINLNEDIQPQPQPFLNQFASGQGVDIIIVYGQSNAAGWGNNELSSNLGYISEKNIKAEKCNSSTDDVSTNNENCIIFNSLSDPSDIYKFPRNLEYYSAWNEFSRFLEQNSHREIVLVNAAFGGRNINSLINDDELIGVAYYDNLLFASESAINHIGRERINTVSLFWLQGEADVYEMANSSFDEVNEKFKQYFVDLDVLYNNLLNDLNIPKMLLYVIRLGASITDNEIVDILAIDLGYWQIEFCKTNNNFFPLSILPSTFNKDNETLSIDGVHYTPYGYDLIGRDSAVNFSNYLENNDTSEILYQENYSNAPTIINEKPF